MIKIGYVFVALFLSACSVGVRYQSPGENQDSAEFYGAKKSTIYTLNEDSCVSSYSFVSDKIKIHASKVAIISYYEKIGSNHECRIWLSFMPEKDAKYELETDLVRSEEEKKSLLTPIFSKAQCFARIVKINSDGTKSPVDIKREEFNKLTAACKQK